MSVGGGIVVMRPTLFLAMIFVLALPIVTHSQGVAPPTNPCLKQFPYGPEKFLEKLIAVAGEVDSENVLHKFQESFGVKLHYMETKDHLIHTYNVTRCEWYAHVIIASATDAELTAGAKILLTLGDSPQSLSFGDSLEKKCLSANMLEQSLTVSGWEGGARSGETVTWDYRKGPTRLRFGASGATPEHGPCVSVITVGYQ
jgi:hypothetical protein